MRKPLAPDPVSRPATRFARLRHASGAWAILLVYLVLLPLLRPVVSPIDPVGYYAWARSLLIDHNLDVTDEFAHYQMPPGLPRTPTGYLHNQWPAGSAIVWLPAMALAHAGVLVARALGAGLEADGYTWPYVLAAALTSSVAGLAAVWLCRRLARPYFGDFAATAAGLTVWLATPLVFFQFAQPLMAHANDAFINALCILLWNRTRQSHASMRGAFALGVATGAAVWIRTQNGILLLAFLLDAGIDLLNTVRLGGLQTAWPAIRYRMLPLGAGFAVLAVPLLLFWRAVYGVWLLNTYTATGGGAFNWTAPHALDVLVSSNRGLFTWAPVTLLAVAGLRWLWRADRRLTLLLSFVCVANGYVIASWSAWSGGDTPGPRLWLSLTPVFVLGLAALFDRLRGRSHVLVVGVGSALVGWNVLLIAQYMLGMIAPAGEVDMRQMAVNQIAVIDRLIGLILRR